MQIRALPLPLPITSCHGLMLLLPNSYVEVKALTPCASEFDCIWKEGLKKGN